MIAEQRQKMMNGNMLQISSEIEIYAEFVFEQ